MTTLTVAATTNYSAGLPGGQTNVDLINVTNTSFVTGATATFSNTQFNNIVILNNVAMNGSSGVNRITVDGGSVNASDWNFTNWTPGFFDDEVRLNGGAGDDTCGVAHQGWP
jgi:hypothetical protein